MRKAKQRRWNHKHKARRKAGRDSTFGKAWCPGQRKARRIFVREWMDDSRASDPTLAPKASPSERHMQIWDLGTSLWPEEEAE